MGCSSSLWFFFSHVYDSVRMKKVCCCFYVFLLHGNDYKFFFFLLSGRDFPIAIPPMKRAKKVKTFWNRTMIIPAMAKKNESKQKRAQQTFPHRSTAIGWKRKKKKKAKAKKSRFDVNFSLMYMCVLFLLSSIQRKKEKEEEKSRNRNRSDYICLNNDGFFWCGIRSMYIFFFSFLFFSSNVVACMEFDHRTCNVFLWPTSMKGDALLQRITHKNRMKEKRKKN